MLPGRERGGVKGLAIRGLGIGLWDLGFTVLGFGVLGFRVPGSQGWGYGISGEGSVVIL